MSLSITPSKNYASKMGTVFINSLHPAFYVLLGYSVKIDSKLPSWNIIGGFFTHINAKDIEDYVSQKINTLGNHLSFEGAKKVFHFAGRTITQFYSPIAMLQEHSFEIGIAAAWHFASILTNVKLLNKLPIFESSPKIRSWVVAPAIGLGITWAACQFGLKKEIDPKIFLNIAIKVGVIGGSLKIINKTSQIFFKCTKGSTDKISHFIKKTCDFSIKGLKLCDWNGVEGNEQDYTLIPQTVRVSIAPIVSVINKLSVGIMGEAIIRSSGFEKTLNLASSQISLESIPIGTENLFSNLFIKNSEWLAITAGLIFTYSIINQFAKKGIENKYARNFVSGYITVLATQLVIASRFSHPDFFKTLSIAIRLLGYYGVLKITPSILKMYTKSTKKFEGHKKTEKMK